MNNIEMDDKNLDNVSGGLFGFKKEVKCPDCGSKDFEESAYSTRLKCKACGTIWEDPRK